MKAFLMHSDRDFDAKDGPLPNQEALTQDLDLNTVFAVMAAGDEFLFGVAQRAVFASLDEPEAIVYRQGVLADCLERPAIVREMYDIAVASIEAEKQVYRGTWGRSPNTILHGSAQALGVLVGLLKRLRGLADEHAAEFGSQGFKAFFEMITSELDDDYLRDVEDHLRTLRFRRGVLVSAELGKGNKGTSYMLRRPTNPSPGWMERLASLGRRPGYGFQIADRDEAGARMLGELRDRGINLVANAVAQSADHIVSFFSMMRVELGFYLGCLNLHDRLAEKGAPTCFPVPSAPDSPALTAHGLYDPCLALKLEEKVVGNGVSADEKALVMITGANQGGKSTLLRSVGVAQLMMQAGMAVPAEAFRANVCDGVFTHFKREEDATMKSGKLDEELARMSDIADRVTPTCLLLCNESFAATNEREGSEIARQIIRAMLESGVKVVFVTHMFDLAHGLYVQAMDAALFLRAERLADGQRTFKLVEGEPLPTSYGEDVYRTVFGPTRQETAPEARTPEERTVVREQPGVPT